MGLAMIGGRQLRIDPQSVAWQYEIKAQVLNTLGGKVVQVFGTRITDMVVLGEFGSWQEQESFLNWAKEASRQQLARAAAPMRFIYTPKGWDLGVQLKRLTSGVSQESVRYDQRIVAPKFELTLFVVEEHVGLTQAAMDKYLARIAEGLGWAPSKYSGPLTQDEVEELVRSGSTTGDIREYIALRTTPGVSPAMAGVSSATGLPPAFPQ